MSYEPGKMGISAGTALVFTTTFTSFFLSMWSVYSGQVATAAWFIPLIGSGSFTMMFLILLFVMVRTPGDLYEVSERLLGKIGAKLITVYFITTFGIDTVLTLRQFAENTLLTALPSADISMIMGCYMLTASIFIYLGIEPIARATHIVLPFGLTALTFLMIMLYNKIHLYNLSPWMGQGLPVLFKVGVPTCGLYLNAFLLPILASSFQNLKTIRTAALLGIGLTAVFRTLTLFVYTGIFSAAVGAEKVLPFYEMARLVYLTRFIQRLESFFIVLWVIFGLATIMIELYVAAYLLTRLFKLASIRPIVLPLAIIVVQLALLPSDIATTIDLNTKVSTIYYTFGVVTIPVILLIATLIKGKRKAKSCTVN